MSLQRFLFILFVLPLLLLGQGQGISHAMNESANRLAQKRPLSPTEVADFVDQFMATQLAQLPVPGAAIVVVSGDQILHAQGYGVANLEGNHPVSVTDTLFRIGSVSKLFTATAVMQLVEQDQIELEADINQYLRSFQLPLRFGKPVTVADLLLHTAGFDDIFFGMHTQQADALLPLSQYLAQRLPERYLPPGEFISYNDHGYTLAGLLVEEVSGLSFDAYMAQHILQPLGMDNSSFSQPLPTAQQAQLAVGYGHDGTAYHAYPLDFVQVSPAAGLIAPAAEMGHFLQAHLNGGQFHDAAILRPETVTAMQKTQVQHHPALRGRGYGFSEWQENGYRAVFHDGGNPGFLNRMMLLPEEKVGFFITFNGDQFTPATRLHRAFTTEFFDTFFPEEQRAELPVENTAVSHPASQFAGYYRDVTAYSHDTFQKLKILTEQFQVQADGGQLKTFGLDYIVVDPLHYQSSDGNSHIIFRQDEQGNVTHLFAGTAAYAKLAWYETQPVQIGLIIWFLLTFATAVGLGLGWRGGGALRMLLPIIGLLNLIFLVGVAIVLLQIDPWQLIYGPPPLVLLLLTIPLVTLGLTLLTVLLLLNGWRAGNWQWGTRLLTAVLTLSLLAFPLFLNGWNLFGYRY